MESNKKIILHIDWNSAPARAVMSFCKLTNIPFEVKEVSVAKQEMYKKDFEKINKAK